MTLLSPPLMTFVLLCLLFILIFSLLPWLTLTSRLISWRTCHPLSLVISPLFVRVISLWKRFCLLSVGWPDLRPLVLMAFPWTSILSFGLLWALILFLYLIPALILADSIFLRAVVHSCSDRFWPVLCGLGGPLLSSVESSINVNGNISPFFHLLHVVILVGLVWPL